MDNIDFYIITFENEERINKLKSAFKNVGINNIKVPPAVYHDKDKRFIELEDKSRITEPRTWAIMTQHLDALRDFVAGGGAAGTTKYCIVCEDDILLTKTFSSELIKITKDFKEMNLQLLLLGYLMPYSIDFSKRTDYPLFNKRNYYDYPSSLWGSQMYMVSRDYASQLIEKYTLEWAYNNTASPYSPDWIITKCAERKALIYPMLALETGIVVTDNKGQIDFHAACFKENYIEDEFINDGGSCAAVERR
jgi:hypothetical protein